VVVDMSSAFIAGIKVYFAESRITVDCFLLPGQVRRDEANEVRMPKATRWMTLKKFEGEFT